MIRVDGLWDGYISYSGRRLYGNCPYAYWHRYVNGTILPGLPDTLATLYGDAVGNLFGRFYVDEGWRDADATAWLLARVDETVTRTIRYRTQDKDGSPKAYLGWRDAEHPKALYVDLNELMSDVRATVARGLQIIRHYRLLGKKVRVEHKLDLRLPAATLAGRSDFMMHRTRPNNDRVILDGKGSRWREKYEDPKQLAWYAMLCERRYGYVPDRVGFVFWRYWPPESVDWYEPVKNDLDDLYEATLGVVVEIRGLLRHLADGEDPDQVFVPKPTRQQCQFCDYSFGCKKKYDARTDSSQGR
jgi:hypothetical protein